MAPEVSRRAVIGSLAALGGAAIAGGLGYTEARSGAAEHGIPGAKLSFTRTGNTSSFDKLISNINQQSSDLPLPEPFQVPLPIPAVLRPSGDGTADHYRIRQTVARQEIIPGYRTEIWGYNGTFPGPTIIARRDRQTVVTHTNELPVPSVVHLHGGHTPPDSDGFPTDLVYGPRSAMPGKGMAVPGKGMGMSMRPDPHARISHGSYSYRYPNDQPGATLWYHDHRMDFTGPSVYRGLAGFYLIRDPQEQALPLPSGNRDIPLMFADRAFAADGALKYPALDPTMARPGVEHPYMQGVLGDVMLVNGAPWPVLDVDTARYRFRLLNASNARVLRLALSSPRVTPRIVQIGSDAGLLGEPIEHDELVIAPGQRFEIVLDFSGFKVGDELTLVNRSGAGSTGVVMRFRVAHRVVDRSRVPDQLVGVSAIPMSQVQNRRHIDFHNSDQGWLINGKPFDPSVSVADVRRDATELWEFTSDYHHPVHVHLVSFQVVSRDGRAPGPYDAGWKDTVFVNGGERVQVIARFHGETGRYILHCHNLEHEDMSMMATFHVV